MIADIIGKVKNKVRQRVVLLYLFDRLAEMGITIIPYYITHECLSDETDLRLNPKLEQVTAGFLSLSQIKEVYSHHEIKATVEEGKKLLDEGCLCFALKYNNEVAACTWCNLRRCHDHLSPFVLRGDEAYLFGAHTFKAYRGENLALFKISTLQTFEPDGTNKILQYYKIFQYVGSQVQKKVKGQTD